MKSRGDEALLNAGLFRHVAPLSERELVEVPGVLGDISRERAADYAQKYVQGYIRGEALDALESVSRPSFAAALSTEGLSLIAEVKRSSPSKGAIADLDPVAAAQAYERGGASALSILTEPRHFGGALEHLQRVSEGVSLPLLRKDFTVHPLQLFEAVSAGASAALLIVAVLGERTKAYLELAHSLGLDALVEVHDDAELGVALETGARIIGVNNRDLRTLHIDLDNAPGLIGQARAAGFTGLCVAESGYRHADELRSVQGLADAVLVGSSLAGSGELEAAVRRLLGR